MSKGHSLKLWKGDSPEPKDYNIHRDPSHSVDQMLGCYDLQTLTKKLTQSLKNWMDNPTGCKFEAIILALKNEWILKGGGGDVFDKAMEMAYIQSNFYRRMLK